MVRVDINSDVESESDASLDLEIDSDGATCLFMFKPQHDTNSEEEDSSNHQEMVESDADVLPYCNLVLFCKSCIVNCIVNVIKKNLTPMELYDHILAIATGVLALIICCQEMDVLGDRLDLQGRN